MKPHLSYHPEKVKSSQNELCFDLDMIFKFGELQVFIIGNNILKYYGDTIKWTYDIKTSGTGRQTAYSDRKKVHS